MIDLLTRAREVEPSLQAFLRDIVAIPSFSGEALVVDRIRGEMEALGFETHVDPMGNCIGRVGRGPHVIAIDGHCDTVGVGNPDFWEVDPFQGAVKDGFVYGRGAADQKGGIAAAVYAGFLLREAGLSRNSTLLVTATVQEEDYEGACWSYLVEEHGIRPEAVVLTEPSQMGIRIGQRGRMEIKIRVPGVSCHGSAPERGVNAINRAAAIVGEVDSLHRSLDEVPPLGKGSVAVTDIRSTAPSLCAVPDCATLHLDRRLTLGETWEQALEQVAALDSVRRAGASVFVPENTLRSYTGLERKIRAVYPAWIMDRNDELVRAAVEVHSDLFRRQADVGCWVFSTNGVATKGKFGIPTIGFGPGSEALAHAPNERIKMDEVVRASAFYAALVSAWGKRQGAKR